MLNVAVLWTFSNSCTNFIFRLYKCDFLIVCRCHDRTNSHVLIRWPLLWTTVMSARPVAGTCILYECHRHRPDSDFWRFLSVAPHEYCRQPYFLRSVLVLKEALRHERARPLEELRFLRIRHSQMEPRTDRDMRCSATAGRLQQTQFFDKTQVFRILNVVARQTTTGT
jgi:hypothetical protein